MALVVDPTLNSQMSWVIEALHRDDVVALPSETVYGLAGKVFRSAALSKIFKLKARPHFDPLIAHVNSIEMAQMLALKLSKIQMALMKEFWPGPLTLLCQKSHLVPDLCTAGSSYVAIRMPSHPVFLNVISALNEPLAAPSANRFQGISPTNVKAVLEELGPHGLYAVVDGGACTLGIESTVVGVDETTMTVQVYRPGALQVESLEVFLKPFGYRVEMVGSLLDKNSSVPSPGMIEKHYSPQKPVVFFERSWISRDSLDIDDSDLLLFVTKSDHQIFASKFSCESNGLEILGTNDLVAASKLFESLRQFDQNKKYSRLMAFAPESKGLGLAIADRLRRAAGKA